MRLWILGIAICVVVYWAGYSCGANSRRLPNRAEPPQSRVQGDRSETHRGTTVPADQEFTLPIERGNSESKEADERSVQPAGSAPDFVDWYASHRSSLSLPDLSEELQEAFQVEFIEPLGSIPERETLIKALEVYQRFHPQRQELRDQRAHIYNNANRDLPTSDPVLAPLFEREREVVRDFFAGVRSSLGDAIWLSLRRSDHWLMTAELAGVGALETKTD